MRTSDYGKQWDEKRKYQLITILAILFVVGMVFFFVFYRVEHIEIQESSHYSKDEIENMVLKGFWKRNSVLAPKIYTKDVDGIPFVEGYVVEQVNRNTILVSLKEKQAVGCIKYLDCYVYFDRVGKIIEISVDADRKIPYFDGLKVESVVMGEDIKIKDEILNTAISLVRIFEKNDSIPDHIIFDKKYYITLEYGDIQAKLGEDQFLEDKMARLIAILPKLSGKKGILHMEGVSQTSTIITFEGDSLSEDEAETTDTEETTDMEKIDPDKEGSNANSDTESQQTEGTYGEGGTADTYGYGNTYGYGDAYGYGDTYNSDGTYGYGNTYDYGSTYNSDGTYGYGYTYNYGSTYDSNSTYGYGTTDSYGYTYDYGYGDSSTYGYDSTYGSSYSYEYGY